MLPRTRKELRRQRDTLQRRLEFVTGRNDERAKVAPLQGGRTYDEAEAAALSTALALIDDVILQSEEASSWAIHHRHMDRALAYIAVK